MLETLLAGSVLGLGTAGGIWAAHRKWMAYRARICQNAIDSYAKTETTAVERLAKVAIAAMRPQIQEWNARLDRIERALKAAPSSARDAQTGTNSGSDRVTVTSPNLIKLVAGWRETASGMSLFKDLLSALSGPSIGMKNGGAKECAVKTMDVWYMPGITIQELIAKATEKRD